MDVVSFLQIWVIGVPTLKKFHPIWLGDEYFEQFFMRISKM